MAVEISSSAPIVQLVDSLASYLGSATVTTAYPDLAGVQVNSYDDDHLRYPCIDIHPVSEDAGAEGAGRVAESALAVLEVQVWTTATKYKPAMRKAWAIANAVRKALNRRSAAKDTGANFVRAIGTNLAEPEYGEKGIYIKIVLQVEAGYQIDAT